MNRQINTLIKQYNNTIKISIISDQLIKMKIVLNNTHTGLPQVLLPIQIEFESLKNGYFAMHKYIQ